MRRKTSGILISLSLVILLAFSGCSSGPSAAPTPQGPRADAANAASVGGAAAAAGTDRVKPKARVLSAAAVQPPSGFEAAAENDSLALFVNKKTSEVAIADKRSGKLYYSNPQDRDADSVASDFQKGMLGGQLFLTYLDRTSNYHNFDNYNDSIAKDQFTIEAIPNGLKITYTIGDTELGIEALPKLIGKDRMQKLIFDKVDKSSQRAVLKHYVPQEKNPDVYERFDDSFSKFSQKQVLDIFSKAGYSEKDLVEDNRLNGVGGSAGNGKAVFTVPLEYTLDGDQLAATVPVKEIKESEGYQLIAVDLLNYFGAGGAKDDGYLLVPDGSGALIRFNNGKTYGDAYAQYVYDEDQTNLSKKGTSPSSAARLPVFGIKSGDQAVVGIISEGDAVAAVNADVSGRTNAYNYAFAGFQLRYHKQVALHGSSAGGSTSSVNEITQAAIYSGDLQVRYGFLGGDQADYEGMAKLYRDYLIKEDHLTALEPSKSMPFYLDLVGAVPKRATFLGIPYQKMVPLTSFGDAKQIVAELQQGGVSNIQLRYLGWFNHGMGHTVADHISVDGELGGKSGFLAMTQYMQEHSVKVYPDASLTRVYRKSWGFNTRTEAAREIIRQIAEFDDYNVADNYMGDGKSLLHYFVLSPNALPDVVGGFLNSYKSYRLDGISLRYFGDVLNSDYNVKKPVDRVEAESIYRDQLSRIARISPNVMVTGGNAYVLPYAKQIVDMPLGSSGFIIEDESVPFYQMVIHGFINYAGEPVNLNANQDVVRELLKSLEYGAYPHFRWFHESNTQVLGTPFESIYSGNYRNWIADAESLYSRMDPVYARIRNQPMVGHSMIQDGVYKTTYANGAYVIVNYNRSAVTVDGQSIGPENFAAGGGA